MIEPETSMRGTSIEQLGRFAKQVFFSNKEVDQRIPFKPPDIYKFSTPRSSLGAIYQITMNIDKGVCLKYQIKSQNVEGELCFLKPLFVICIELCVCKDAISES